MKKSIISKKLFHDFFIRLIHCEKSNCSFALAKLTIIFTFLYLDFNSLDINQTVTNSSGQKISNLYTLLSEKYVIT
ncbi:hypothetical protein HOF65_01825 [bacterium]|nr:hypothetical protein [bacterium]